MICEPRCLLQGETECHSSNRSNVHATQISALFGIIELSAKYPVARECLNDLDTESVIRRVPLTVNQNTSDTRDVIELATLCRRCQICLKETEVYGLWRKFFLAGDAYEREKVALQMLSFVRFVFTLTSKDHFNS